MAYDSRVYRILVASPSDVLEEREAAVRVMQDWNDLHSNNRRVVILPLRWETHTAPEYNVRPQEAINRRIVDDCDLVVGIFWTKLGTPTGEADSGTLEEIERVAKAGKPVMLYFSHVPVDPNRVDLAQLERLRAFKESILTNALVETFGSPLDFRDKFASQLELKIRDLQKADSTGRPLPLNLEFLSLDTGELTGNTLSTSVYVLELSDPDVSLEAEIKPHFERVFHRMRREAGVVPVALTIKNIGSSGIRNLYVEMSIKAGLGTFQVSHSYQSRSTSWLSSDVAYLWSTDLGEPSEIEQKLERLSGEGLTKDGEEWKYSFEWDALQPQRVRLVQPFTFLQVSESCKADFSAKVYADSFANPIVLHAHMTVEAHPGLVQTDAVVAKAKELKEAQKTTYVTSSSGIGEVRRWYIPPGTIGSGSSRQATASVSKKKRLREGGEQR
jgi:hypothetical protein